MNVWLCIHPGVFYLADLLLYLVENCEDEKKKIYVNPNLTEIASSYGKMLNHSSCMQKNRVRFPAVA